MTFTKIDKRKARKLFNEGKDFWIVPCNLRPVFGNLITKRTASMFHNNFYELIGSFTYCQCDSMRGRYPSFYIDDSGQ